MPTAAIFAKGTLCKVGDGATPTENFTTIPECMDIAGPSEEGDLVEVTNHDSPGRSKEWIAGLYDPGELKFTVNLQPGNSIHAQLRTDVAAGTRRNYQLVYPPIAATTRNFGALVTKFDQKASQSEQLQADVTLKITGTIT